MSKTGKTTGNLKMRSGPGMQFEPPIAYLVPGTALEIIDEQGDWLHVRAAGKEGYVGRKYVEIAAAPNLGSAGDIKQGGGLGKAGDVQSGGLGHAGGSIKQGGQGSNLGRAGGGPVGGSPGGNKKGLEKK